MSYESNDRQLVTHRLHTHSIAHRENSLLVAQILPPAPRFAASYYSLKTHAASASTSTITATVDSPGEFVSASEASHELFDYCTSELDSAPDATFESELNALDFSLTRRLLGAVFFLLIIYAWKQYIGDEDESDLIYI